MLIDHVEGNASCKSCGNGSIFTNHAASVVVLPKPAADNMHNSNSTCNIFYHMGLVHKQDYKTDHCIRVDIALMVEL